MLAGVVSFACNAILDNREGKLAGGAGNADASGIADVGVPEVEASSVKPEGGDARLETGAGGAGGDAASDGPAGSAGIDARVGDAAIDVSGPPPGDAGLDRDAAFEAGGLDGNGEAAPRDAGPDGSSCVTGGPCAAMLVTSAGAEITALTVAAPYLYFLYSTGASTSRVGRVATSGGSFETLSAFDEVLTGLVADSSYLYSRTGNPGSVMVSRMPIIGSAFTPIPGGNTQNDPHGLRINSTLVFYGEAVSMSYVEWLPKVGGTGGFTVGALGISSTEFEVDETFAYVMSSSGISRVPVMGAGADGGVTVVTAADPGEAIGDIALAGDRVVFASSTRVGSALGAGSAASTLDPGAAYALATDASYAFYFRARARGDGGPACANGSDLYAMPIAGGARQRMASELPSDAGACPFAVVQDASAVYWVSADRTTIMKVGK